MSKQTVAIEVEIPDGYESTGEHRRPENADAWLGNDEDVHFGSSDYKRIILRKKFVWPEWVKPGTWYTRDEDGREELRHKDAEPSLSSTGWSSRSAKMFMIIDREMVDFPAPVICDWRQSKMQKPL